MREVWVWEVDDELFATEALANEAIRRVNKHWGKAVGYRPQPPHRRPIHCSMSGLMSWAGKGKWTDDA